MSKLLSIEYHLSSLSVFLYMLNVVNKTAGAGEECWDVLADKWETASRLGRLWTDESSAWVDHFTAQSQQQRPVWQVEGWKRRGWSSLSLCCTMVFFSQMTLVLYALCSWSLLHVRMMLTSIWFMHMFTKQLGLEHLTIN